MAARPSSKPLATACVENSRPSTSSLRYTSASKAAEICFEYMSGVSGQRGFGLSADILMNNFRARTWMQPRRDAGYNVCMDGRRRLWALSSRRERAAGESSSDEQHGFQIDRDSHACSAVPRSAYMHFRHKETKSASSVRIVQKSGYVRSTVNEIHNPYLYNL